MSSGDSTPLISAEAAQMILWITLFALLLVVTLVVLDKIPGMRDKSFIRDDTIRDTAPDAVQARMETARGEADALAGEGNYAEAIHILLLQGLAEMRLRLNVPIALSLTSREILHHIRLEPQAHDALADIIGRVEISYFGDYQPGLEEYDACRASYQTLMSVLRQGRAA